MIQGRSGGAADVATRLFAIVISYVIWYTSVQAVDSERTAAITNLIPVVAVVSGWALLGEPLGWPQVLGAAIVLFGVWLARRPEPSKRPKASVVDGRASPDTIGGCCREVTRRDQAAARRTARTGRE